MDTPQTAHWLPRLLHGDSDPLQLHRRHLSPAFVELLQLVGFGRRFVRARGCELWDEQGRVYLDLVGGYGVHNLGHNHPAVREALCQLLQLEPAGMTQVDCPLHEGLAAQALCRALPGKLERVFFCQSGSEAVEACIKLARLSTGRKRLLYCDGAYHGKTAGALSLMGNAQLKNPFRPLCPGVQQLPFGDLAALEQALRWGDVAALVLEPIQGEGGARPLPPGVLAAAAALCREHGALLVLDEVQSGLGRTGRMLACEHEGVEPDVVALAKGLSGGLVPVGAMVATDEVYQRAFGSLGRCRLHTTTFGGAPLAMAAVLATLRVLEKEQLVRNARQRGEQLHELLQPLVQRHRGLQQVQGQGLLLGLRLSSAVPGLPRRGLLGGLGRSAAALYAQYLALRLLEHGVVTQVAANDLGVLKLTPPLCIDEQQVERVVQALDAVLGERSPTGALLQLAAKLVHQRLEHD